MKITDIQEHVTHFSEQLRANAKHGDEVTVGGKILSIVPPIGELRPMYGLMIDDFLGTICLLIPESMYEFHQEEIQVGNFIVLEGFVNLMTRKIHNETVKDMTIVAYAMQDITTIGETN